MGRGRITHAVLPRLVTGVEVSTASHTVPGAASEHGGRVDDAARRSQHAQWPHLWGMAVLLQMQTALRGRLALACRRCPRAACRDAMRAERCRSVRLE